MDIEIEEVEENLSKLRMLKDDDFNINEQVKETMKQVVPTYKEPEEVNSKVK